MPFGTNIGGTSQSSTGFRPGFANQASPERFAQARGSAEASKDSAYVANKGEGTSLFRKREGEKRAMGSVKGKFSV